MEILKYERKYLTLEEVGIINLLLGKFKVMDPCIFISLWLKGDDYLTNYLGMFWITYFFYRPFQIAHVTTVHSFANLKARIYMEEKRKRWEKIQVSRRVTNSPYSHLEGFIIKGRKIKVEERAPDSRNVKAQWLEDGSLHVVGNILPTTGRASTQTPPEGKAQLPPSSLWSDFGFNTLQFIIFHHFFSK